MIYIFERLPLNVTDEQGLIRAFSKLKLNASDYKELVNIEKEKQLFYKFFQRSLHDKSFIPKIEEIEDQKKYFKVVYDLMRIGLKADYSIVQVY